MKRNRIPVLSCRLRSLPLSRCVQEGGAGGSAFWGMVLVAASCLLGGCTRDPEALAAVDPAASVREGRAGPTTPGSDFPVLINSEPMFDSQGAWSEGYLKARGAGPGVVVGPGAGNPNVFAQAFSAKPGEQFRVVARAVSASGAAAMARIQINWTDAGGRFLGVSSQTFEVATEPVAAEVSVSAPDDASSGTLYVVPDGRTSVIRYLEMRLLGRSVLPARSGSAVAVMSSVQSGPGSMPAPPDLRPLDHSGRQLSAAESQYYFYQAARTLDRRARERGMDFIMYVMPDFNIARLMPAIERLRREGIKVIAYAPEGSWTAGVDTDWYWQRDDSHWSPEAVRLTADEILRMHRTGAVSNRSFSPELKDAYAKGFPQDGGESRLR